MKNNKFRKDYEKFNKAASQKDLWGDKWQEICEKVHEDKRAKVVQEILNNNHKHICDFGCGTGRIAELLRKRGFKGKIDSIDIHLPEKLKERAKNYNIHIKKGDFKKIKTKKYGGVIFFSCIHFATLQEIEKIIDNLGSKIFYLVEAVKEFPENVTLDEKVKGRTNGKCGIFYESDLDKIFNVKGYNSIRRHVFPLDELSRILVLKVYKR